MLIPQGTSVPHLVESVMGLALCAQRKSSLCFSAAFSKCDFLCERDLYWKYVTSQQKKASAQEVAGTRIKKNGL